MNLPLVSIVIAAYNCENSIKKCLDSLVNQSYKNLNIIVIDDGSKDMTGEICRKYASTVMNIDYYYQENNGVAVARNMGLSRVKGEWFMFVDSDDWLEIDAIERMIDAIDSKTDIAFFDAFINMLNVQDRNVLWDTCDTKLAKISKGQVQLQCLSRLPKLDAEPKYMHCGTSWGKLYKTQLIRENKICFKTDLTIGEDMIFTLEASEYANNIIYLPLALYHYYINPKSITHRYNKNIFMYYTNLVNSIEDFIVSHHDGEMLYEEKFAWFYIESINIMLNNKILANQMIDIKYMRDIMLFQKNGEKYYRFIDLDATPKRFLRLANNIKSNKWLQIMLLSNYKTMKAILKAAVKRLIKRSI